MAKESRTPKKSDKSTVADKAVKADLANADKQLKTPRQPALKIPYNLDATAQKIIDTFAQISAIPRKSGNEECIRQFLIDWARNNKFLYITDKVGNLIIKIAASKGMEDRATIVLQGHLDMVCEKTPDSTHDFSKDPISFVYDGEWLEGKMFVVIFPVLHDFRHGQGTYTYANGDVYSGTWNQDRRHGKGTGMYSGPGGTVAESYEGDWLMAGVLPQYNNDHRRASWRVSESINIAMVLFTRVSGRMGRCMARAPTYSPMATSSRENSKTM